MKRIIVSAGLVTVSVVGLQAVNAPGLTRLQTSKWWTVSGTLRGFYDDNYFTLPSSQDPQGSLGIEIMPSIAANFPREQTYIGLSYQYDARWYEDREENQWDQSHQVVGKLDHKFSPRYNLKAEEVFTYSDEPELLEPGATITTPTRLRTDASAVRNRVDIGLNGLLTEQLGFDAGFANSWYDYFQDADKLIEENGGGVGVGSRAALLNRLEYEPHINLRYQAREDLVGLMGYKFGYYDYTSDDPVAVETSTGRLVPGSERSSMGHYLYVGGEHTLTAKLSASLQVGARYTDFIDLNEGDGWSPYLDLSGSYQYLPGSFLRGGVKYDRNATDATGTGDTTLGSVEQDLTTDQETLTFYAQVSHRISSRLTGHLTGQLQGGTFQNGAYDGETDWFYMAGINLEYRFNQHFTGEVGYNFDRLDSDLDSMYPFGRSYSRNRVYLGVRATY